MDVFVVDAFADTPFAGNPAAVVLMTEQRDEHWMQRVAAEMNLSETAFVDLIGAGRPGNPIPLRWFTPAAEVDLCGHATLAAAHALGGELRFATRSGILTAICREGGWVELDLPADDQLQRCDDVLTDALPAVTIKSVHKGSSDWLVELDSAAEVRDVQPNFEAIATLGQRGVLVTAAGVGEIDFVSRCFFPVLGVDEDPVTGSAHCALGPFWGARLDKTELVAQQMSKRGGTVRMQLRGGRVGLLGRAHTVLTGSLHA